MNELIEHYEGGLALVVSLLKLTLETIAVFCIFLGTIKTGKLAIFLAGRRQLQQPFFEVKLCLGSWLALALEFQLGADILATTVAPSFQSLGQLGAIAVIRTFLNYFLSKEIESEYELQKKSKIENE